MPRPISREPPSFPSLASSVFSSITDVLRRAATDAVRTGVDAALEEIESQTEEVTRRISVARERVKPKAKRTAKVRAKVIRSGG